MGSGNGEVTNSTARLLCPKKALNRTNLTKSNYSGSGRRGKPLEVGIKFLGRESVGKTAKVSAGIAVCGTGSLVLGGGTAGRGDWPRSLHWPLGEVAFLQRQVLTLESASAPASVCVFHEQYGALWFPPCCPARSRPGCMRGYKPLMGKFRCLAVFEVHYSFWAQMNGTFIWVLVV